MEIPFDIDIAAYLKGAAGALILSAGVRALPEPDENSTKFYLWFHKFTNLVLSNYDKLKPTPK